MSLVIQAKKRSSLENVVDKLSRDVAAQKLLEVVVKANEQVEEPTSVLEQDPYLVSPNPSSPAEDVVLSDPVSPSGSVDAGYDEQSDTRVEVINTEGKESRKSIPSSTVHRKRSSLGGFLSKTPDHCPKAPMRCDVCGLRVYKSYRYISRTSAPLHLKSFVIPSVDRFRVCKRCFSSRERCRQNLALILLKSKTSQMMHLRTPLGVTDTRATKGIEYIVRDLKDKLKRPYDDLLCDETLLDEDQMSNEEFPEKEERSSEPATKVTVVGNGSFESEMITAIPLSSRNIGVVTVVRPNSGLFNVTPNCYTLYGEMVDTKIGDNQVIDGSTKQAQAASLEAKMTGKSEEVTEKKMINGGLSIEINSINNKLTLLDHAYALPPPKSKATAPKNAAPVTKPAKTNDVKAPKSSPAKSAAQPAKKASDTSDDQSEPVRTCGIVCSMCDKLVTKSYSCYNKDTAPEKVHHLFSDSIKVIKICRRCCPYKKPKVDDDSKVIKKPGNKLVKSKSVKAKKSSKTKSPKTADGKSIKQGDPGKNENSPQGPKPRLPGSPVKNAHKDGREDEKKHGKETDKHSVVKVSNAGSQTDKTSTAKFSIKDVKVDKLSPESKTTSKSTQLTIKTRKIKKEEHKVVEVKADNQKFGTVKGNGQSATAQAQIPDKTKMKEKSVSPNEQASKWSEKHKGDCGNKQWKKTEIGTQSSCSLIGVKVKLKMNVASDDMDAQLSGEKIDPETLKAAGSVQQEDLVPSKNPVLEKKVDAIASDSSGNLCEMNEESKETDATGFTKGIKTVTCTANGKEGEKKEKEEEIEDIKRGQDEETTEETREGLKAKVEEIDKEEEEKIKQVTEVKEGHTKETTAVEIKTEHLCESSKILEDKSEKANAEDKKADTTNNEAAVKLEECNPKEKGENKVGEASSPRRSRNASTPERKKDTEKPVVLTVMTRKRLASLSETESETSKQIDEPVVKRRVLAVLRDRVLKKNAGSDTAASQASETSAQQERNSQSSSTDSSEADGEASSQKSGQKNDMKDDEGEGCWENMRKSSKSRAASASDFGLFQVFSNTPSVKIRVHRYETQDDSQGTFKPKVQAPIKCASCKHRVVKSYRCIQREISPNHIKPLFAKDANEILRICRRCLKPGQGKYKS